MGVGRALFVLIFPVFFTAVGVVLSIVSFFGSYEHATGLRNVNFMTVDLSNISISGMSSSSFFSAENVSSVYSVGTNGFCSGSSTKNMTSCSTPFEPFYFSFSSVLDEAGLSSIESSLPSELESYNTLSKDITLGVWGCTLAAICLGFIGACVGILAMCSRIATSISEFFVTLAVIAGILAAAMATGVYHVYTSKINDLVGDVGIEATLNSSGLGLIWAAAAAFLVADIFYVITSCCCCMSRRREYVTVPEKTEF